MEKLIIYILAIISLVYIDSKIFKDKEKRLYYAINKKISVNKLIGYSLLFTFSILFLTHLLIYLGFMDYINLSNFKLVLIINMLSTIFLTPIIEEYFFRYLPIKIVNNKSYNLGTMVVSSIIFTSLHNFVGLESLIVFISSIMLFIIYLKSNSILYNICAHGLYNLMVIILTYLIKEINILVIFVDLIIILFSFIILRLKK